MPFMKTVFIDFGNVIGFFDHTRAVRQLEQYSHLEAQALDLAIYGEDDFDEYESGTITCEQFFAGAKSRAGLNCTQAEFYRCFADIFTRNDEVCDVIPTLAARYRLVLASNTCLAHYERYSADYADVLSHFAARCTSFEAGHRKPKRDYYTYCQTFAEAQPHECFFLDDLERNIDAAKAHGWHGLVYKPNMGLRDRLQKLGLLS
jgi:glucose-1-phosphatase